MRGLKKKIRDNKNLNWLLIVSNWIFQSIPNADRTEKIYKIIFTVLFTILFFLMLQHWSQMEVGLAIFLSFIAGHTLNWLVNGNFYNLLIHRLLVRNLSKEELFQYLEDLEERLPQLTWVEYAASFGSICKGQLKDSSDLDVSIVRKKGLRNALKAIYFSVKEKKLADLKKIPLELYISDTPENSINRFKAESVPVVLFDPEGILNQYYSNIITLTRAKVINLS